MKQYGDITKLSGYDLEPVDLIVGGSPCQDLSIAGKRAGLNGERSGLFMEMIRIIREMREKTNGIYPRYALWENVPGAFSSNEGRDFSVVLGEFARLIESGAPDVPVPKEGWPESGVLLVGSGGSIAYRTHDAQYWGVPQRRRRISLVADFRGQSAPEILFERKGVSGDIESSGETGETVTGSSEKSIDKAGTTIYGESVTPTSIARLETAVGNTQDGLIVYDPSVHHDYRQFDDVSETVRSRYGTGGNNQPLVVAIMQGFGDYVESDTASSCKQRDYKDATDLVIQKTYQDKTGSLMASGYNKLGTQEFSNDMYVCGALNAVDYKGINSQYVNQNKCQITNNHVRRLTPLECERLQGYPDRWTDIPGASDSKRYKALGNSIALPFWEYLAKRFVQIGNVKSIGSLFAGIGGFELVFQRAGAETKWDSEIDPFCRKVLEYHFGNEETNKEGES